MIKESTDILRMQLNTSHISSNAGRPHFQKTITYKNKKRPQTPTRSLLLPYYLKYGSFVNLFFQNLYLKKLCQKRHLIIVWLQNWRQ